MLLTGLTPFYTEGDVKVLKKSVKRGETALIDPQFRERSFGERVLADLIPLCWKLNPDDRIDVFGVVERLREAVNEDKKNHGAAPE